jgi:hypothetical protein
MSQRIPWRGLIVGAVIAALAMFVIFEVPRIIIWWAAPAGLQHATWERLAMVVAAVIGAAIATRHWLAPTLTAAAFLLLPVLGWLPVRSAQGWQLAFVALSALALLLVVATLLLVSIVLMVRGVMSNLRPRS